ncbi:MAG: hypothetical protein LBM08_12465 [Dysgonamonadaceae bacterium]|jgi:hypothetical protein|nr:hypothetical protein [Dysgonamonadaceae bacterium]
MNMKNILSWMLLLFGEVIIIAALILFGGETPKNIFVLNIVVCSLVYGLFFCNFRAPWIDLEDKSQKQIGMLGISWFATWFYAIAAIIFMLVANLAYNLAFPTQLIVHSILLFFLIMGMLLSHHSANKVQEVFVQETQNRSRINEMKSAMQQLKDKMNDTAGLPENFTDRINSLEEGVRFISPANNEEAYSLENSFSKIVSDISFAISNFQMNEEAIESSLKKLERVYQNRKSIYSK